MLVRRLIYTLVTLLIFSLALQAGYQLQRISFVNGEELIEVIELTQTATSHNESAFLVEFSLPFFDNAFKGTFRNKTFTGLWWNYAKGTEYSLPFYASAAAPKPENSTVDLSGKWKVVFSPTSPGSYPAIGEFTQEGDQLYGTFLTETGDYRFLEGYVTGNEFKMSAFDGAHAFLFTGTLSDEKIVGKFYSGNHWEENWVAERDDEYKLTDAERLTMIKNKSAQFDFSFPDLNGEMVNLSDSRFDNKVVLVQIMGSWCPNCLDESRLYAELYEKYSDDGLEIVALAYETSTDETKVRSVLNRYIDQLDIRYPVLWAGKASKKLASEHFPMLSKIISFPTTIFIDKEGSVAKIHTGFAGPATDEYDQFVSNLDSYIQKLLAD